MLKPEHGRPAHPPTTGLPNYITPDRVQVLAAGRIIKSGGRTCPGLEAEGYAPILAAAGLEAVVGDEAPESDELGTHRPATEAASPSGR